MSNRKIYTTYFAKVKDLPDGIIPISICGKAPDGWKGLQYKKLAPKWSFFKVWKETKDNDYYIKHYEKEVTGTLDADVIVNELFSMVTSDTIALVCYEKPSDFCHRHLVAKWINENTNIEVREYEDEHVELW